MIDPPRPEVAPALAKAGQAGIRTIMITGDYPNTARAIAESIGLLRPGHQVLTGKQTRCPERRRAAERSASAPTSSPASRRNTRCASSTPCAPTTKWWP